jgi:osmoprotectant transport system ATP-binding protein
VAVDERGRVSGGVGLDDVLAIIKSRKGNQCDTY